MLRVILPVVFVLFGCSYNKSDEYIGAGFLGMPYVTNPLGEGVKPDKDPLIRYDAFDCVTFVETVLANGDIGTLNKIRYKNGNIDFVNRNHFIETDWLENNSWLVENVSGEYAPTKIRNVKIDKKKWFKTVYNMDTDFAVRNVKLEYIPYKYVQDIQIRKPMIVLFIIDNKKLRNKIGTDLAVKHMGFLLPNGILRHASYKHKVVTDVNFSHYVKQIMDNENNLGIMLLGIKK